MRRWLVWVAAAAALLVGVAGCGGGEEADTPTVDAPPAGKDTAEDVPPNQKEIDITLDGCASPQNVGILMASERGYFEKSGLDVWIRTPVSRFRPIPYIVEGEVALSVSHQPQVLMAQQKGARINTFGSLILQPTTALIWPKQAMIDGVADLKGKTIAITGLSFEREFLKFVLARAGIALEDVKVIHADYDLIPPLLEGKADAILGSGNLEGAALEARGVEPVVTPVQDLGVPPYDELVLIARDGRLAKEPGRIRAFMSALTRGTAAAIEDPEAAVNAIVARGGECGGVNRKDMEAGLEATLPLLSETGRVSPDEELADWMRAEGMLPIAAAP